MNMNIYCYVYTWRRWMILQVYSGGDTEDSDKSVGVSISSE